MTQATNNTAVTVDTLPSAKKALYQRIIDNDASTRRDWHDVAQEFCMVVDGKKTFNKELKGVRTEQFTVLFVAKHAPDATAGSDAYKDARKMGQATFGSCVNRALVSMGHKEVATRSKPIKATGGDATAATATANVPVVPAFNASAMTLQHEIVSRIGTLNDALVAFQQDNKLTRKATDAIGLIAADVATLATKAKELGEVMVSGTTPEQAASALQAALQKMVTPVSAEVETQPA
jgi:hypothetical protein